MSQELEASQQFIDTYFSGRADLFKAITSIARTWQTVQHDRPAYQELVFNKWLEYLSEALNRTDGQFPALIERYWWSVAFETAGLSFNEIVMNSYLHILAKEHWQQFKANFEQARADGAIPSNIGTAEEYLALRFSPPEVKLYTNDPVYQVLGVKSEQELSASSNAEFRFKLAKMINDGTFIRLHNAAYHDYRRAFERQGASDKVSLVPDYTGLEPGIEDRIEYLSDSDRLSQFCELAGIDMNTLTDSESSRVLDILNALDTGYDFASKQGVSMAAYYGDKANSEKTQRQRLFKKISENKFDTREAAEEQIPELARIFNCPEDEFRVVEK